MQSLSKLWVLFLHFIYVKASGLKTPELDITLQIVAVFTSVTDPGIRELRRFSSKCKLICLQGSCCYECSQLRRVEMQREKRSKSRQGAIQPKHNNRYVTREQLSSKLKEEKRERKMGKAKEQRLNEKLVMLATSSS